MESHLKDGRSGASEVEPIGSSVAGKPLGAVAIPFSADAVPTQPPGEAGGMSEQQSIRLTTACAMYISLYEKRLHAFEAKFEQTRLDYMQLIEKLHAALAQKLQSQKQEFQQLDT